MSAINGLTIAVPRGALFEDTVELLSELGLDTNELRSNDRKLLFEDIGVITMRPTDVPTYVEAGAADLGITGKDVLLEQAPQTPGETGREVYELLDLGYGRCTMVLASKAGPDPAHEALRRLGVMRVATKYPRIAARHLEETGRQAEIVEVKGSVELAPLTGLVEAIVDLTATGTTLRENNLVVREEIVDLHRTPDRQPGRPQAEGRRRSTTCSTSCGRCPCAAGPEMRLERLDATDVAGLGGPAAAAARLRELVPGGSAVREQVAQIIARVRTEGDAAVAALHPELDTRGAQPPPLLVSGEELDAALRSAPARARRGAAGRDRQRRARRATPASGATVPVELPQGHRIVLREVPVRSAAVYVPGGRAPYPSTVVMGVVTARSAGVIDVVVCALAAAGGRIDPAILGTCRAVRGRARLPHGRRAGDRGARPRHRDGRRRRRDRRAGQPLRPGGQAPALRRRRDRRLRRARATCSSCSAPTSPSASCGSRRSTCSRRPSTARAASSRPSRHRPRVCDALAAMLEAAGPRAPDRRRGRLRGRRGRRRVGRRSRSPTPSPPSTCS